MKSIGEDVIWGVIGCDWMGLPPAVSDIGEEIRDDIVNPLNVL